jgi:2-polyprenyl-6-methoxyphenol hydroxylase-like FAD-dependent oxidoreductase
MYDVIVVGARVAGAATAMLLARKGFKVLAVDQAGFPSDTLSTHQVQLPGVARLAAWGLLDRVVASNAPPTRRVRFDRGSVVLEGRYPAYGGVDALYSPRRTVLDAILVDAARRAGAEVRERFEVDEVLMEDGRVAGIKGREREKGAPAVREAARLVVGADGKRSVVAAAVGAGVYHEQPARTAAFYAYWEGVPVAGGEIYGRSRCAVGAWPTNDGLLMTYVAWPAGEYGTFRADLEGHFRRTLDLAGDLGERLRAGRRVERIRGTTDLPNRFRVPYGPGWALVGDAGLVMDPITGQGIGYALRDAELVAEAIEAGLTGRESLGAALAGYQRARDAASLPMYTFTTELASFPPPRPEQEALFAALATKPAEVDRFLGVLAGAVSLQEYFSPGNLFRVMGVRGMARVALDKALDKLRSALGGRLGAAQRAPGGGGGLPSVEASSMTGSTSVSQG